jgi:predicted dinucleotide-binding enzyme
MKLAFIGIGNVGFALADNLQKKGHEIIIAHDDVKSSSVQVTKEKNPNFSALPVQTAVSESDIIFLATPFGVNRSILEPLQFHGKILIDCTNPVGAGISHGLESKISGAEKVQEWAPGAKVVKSYTIYGYENLMDTTFPKYDVKPVMPIAGDSVEAKREVSLLNTDMGFETLDVGDLPQALHLEHMTLLWVKMVRANGHHPNFTWAYLER